jgi:hypothetical protein
LAHRQRSGAPGRELSLFVSHPGYASDELWEETQKAAGVTTAMLRQESATLTLKMGVMACGRVTDPAGKPIKDAIILRGEDPYLSSRPRQFTTDVDGHFQLSARRIDQFVS